MQLQGVGPKVADCILLFSTLKRFDVFPIDVWVRRVMNDLYIHNSDENKVNKYVKLSTKVNYNYSNSNGINYVNNINTILENSEIATNINKVNSCHPLSFSYPFEK